MCRLTATEEVGGEVNVHIIGPLEEDPGAVVRAGMKVPPMAGLLVWERGGDAPEQGALVDAELMWWEGATLGEVLQDVVACAPAEGCFPGRVGRIAGNCELVTFLEVVRRCFGGNAPVNVPVAGIDQ